MARETKAAAPKAAKIKLPKTLAQCADRYYLVKQARLKEAQKLEPLKAEESALKDHLIENLPKSQAAGITGRVANATITTKDVPVVNDWDKFYAYIKKTGHFHLLGRSISGEAVEELQESLPKGKKIPGIGSFKVVNVSLKKV